MVPKLFPPPQGAPSWESAGNRDTQRTQLSKIHSLVPSELFFSCFALCFVFIFPREVNDDLFR